MARDTRWKGITIDWTALDDYDHEDIIGVCLTQRQVAVLKACLMPAYWSTRWENLTATADELDEFVAEIDNQLSGHDCGGFNMQFRDNPLDQCEVQYSIDLGETWTTMFRKDNCVSTPGTTTTDITNIYIDIDTVVTNNLTWNNTIINVAPDWEYVDSDTDKALCWVIDKYVDWICDFAVEQIESNNQNRRDQNDWLDDVGILLAELAMDVIMASAGALTLPVLAVGAVTYASTQIVEALWDHWVSDSAAHYKDEDTKDLVKCWMWNQIRGETPEFDTWETSMDNFDYSGSTAEEVAVATSVSLFNAEVDIYINWMILFEDINSISDTLPACDCPQTATFDQLAGELGTEFYGTEWTQGVDLAFSNPGDSQAVCKGVWNSSNERYEATISSIGGVGSNIRVTLPIDRLVSQVRVKWGAGRGDTAGTGDKNAGLWLGKPNDGGTYIGGHSWPGGTYEDEFITTSVNDVLGILPTPETHLYIHNSMDTVAGHCYIQWVHVITIPYVP